MNKKKRDLLILIMLSILLLTVDTIFQLGLVNTLSNFLVIFLFLGIALAIGGVKT